MTMVRLNASPPVAGVALEQLKSLRSYGEGRLRVKTWSHCWLEYPTCAVRDGCQFGTEEKARCAETKQTPQLVTVSASIVTFDKHSAPHPADAMNSSYQCIRTSIDFFTPQTFILLSPRAVMHLATSSHPPPRPGSSLKFRGPRQRELTSGGRHPFTGDGLARVYVTNWGTWWTRRPCLLQRPSSFCFFKSCSVRSRQQR
jgi:hypothetical protein